MPIQVIEVPDTVEVSIADPAIIEVYPPGSTSVEVVVGEGGGGIDTNDPRLSDERVPVDGSVTQAKLNSALDVALARVTDPRFTDQRVPTDGSVTDAKVAAGAAIAKAKLAALDIVDADVASGAAIAEAKLALASDAAANVASRRTLGSGATQAAAGNDARLSDARTPLAHNILTAHNGFPGGTSDFLRADGAFAVPPGPAGTFSAYAAAITALTTNPNLGTGGTIAGRFSQIGKRVMGQVRLQFGTSGVSAGSGEYYISLPVDAHTTGGNGVAGFGYLWDNSTGAAQMFYAIPINASKVIMRNFNNSTNVGAAWPWTWAANDIIQLNFTYEAA